MPNSADTPSFRDGSGLASDTLLADLARSDRDRYQLALLSPPACRLETLALYAFNLEVARTPEVVSEVTLGLMRLQWWREALAELETGRARRHPVVEGLGRALARSPAVLPLLAGLLEAREADLDPDPPADLAALESYVRATAGALAEAALLVAHPRAGEAARAAVRAAGTAYGLVGIATAVPFHASQGRVLLPAACLRSAGLAPEASSAAVPGPNLARAVRQVAEAGGNALSSVAAGAVPRAGRAALLHATLARQRLKRLEAAGHDPYAPSVAERPPWQILRLLAARCGP